MTNPLGLDNWVATIVEKAPIVVFEATYEIGPDHCRKCGVSAALLCIRKEEEHDNGGEGGEGAFRD